MRTVHLSAILLLGVSLSAAAGADAKPSRPVGELPEIKGLPNPFTCADGTPVRTRDDWARRRGELKDLFQDYEYGHLPPRPRKMTINRGEPVTDKENKVTLQDLELKLEQGDKALTMRVRLALPQGAGGAVPVVIRSRFGRPGGGGPGAPSGRPFTTFTRRGYAVAECSFQEVAPEAYVSAYLNVPIPFRRQAWRCHLCNAEWEDDEVNTSEPESAS